MGFLIDMIAVGEGDSFLVSIDGPRGEASFLIDAGVRDQGRKVLEFVTQFAPNGLDAVILTHIDNDHAGGMATVLSQAKFKPGAEFVLNVPPAIKKFYMVFKVDVVPMPESVRLQGLYHIASGLSMALTPSRAASSPAELAASLRLLLAG